MTGVSVLRAGLFQVADLLGANRWLRQTAWRHRRLLILCYHGFALRDEHRWDPELFISPERFRARLEYLRAGRFQVLPLSEAVRLLQEDRLPERAVAITVDDGLYDFIAVAAPLLEAFSYPATVYVSTYYVEHPWPVFNVMTGYLLWAAARGGATELRHKILGGSPGAIASRAQQRATWTRLLARVAEAGLSGTEKEALSAQIAEGFGIDYAELGGSRILSLMRPDELRRLNPALFDLQLHTHRHRVPDEREAFLAELAENRTVLARQGRKLERLVHFCYPSGHYRPMHLPWLREAGIVSATTCEPGLASPGVDPLLLPRVIDTDRSPAAEFAAWTSGLRGMLNRRALGL